MTPNDLVNMTILGTPGVYSEDEVRDIISGLQVLRFEGNANNPVATLDGEPVKPFFDSLGRVVPGSVWVCKVRLSARKDVLFAEPLVELTPALMIGLDTALREHMVNYLWNVNREDFISKFEERYRSEVSGEASRAEIEHLENVIEEQKQKISELESKLMQNIAASRDSGVSSVRMIELSTDVEEAVTTEEVVIDAPVADKVTPAVQPVAQAPMIPVRGEAPRIPDTYHSPAPGLPEMSNPAPVAVQDANQYVVTRVGEETLYSESFTARNYFVHISRDGKYLVIRPNGYGDAIAIDRRIRLEGLGSLAPYKGKRELRAEYNTRYDGLLVYLDG